jgi:hypothetical protein
MRKRDLGLERVGGGKGKEERQTLGGDKRERNL